MDKASIRFIQKGEIHQLIELCELHAAYEKSDYNRTGKTELLSDILFAEAPPLSCLVAVINNRIVGYATYMKQFSTWDANYYIYMDCLFLISESRGLGIGQQLIDRIKEESVKQGCDLVQWQTPVFNERAIKFYYRVGANSKSKERFFLNIG